MHRTVESLAPGFQWRLVLLLLLLAAVARAQTGASSVLTGNVVDASTHAPVSDVVVTATSPALQGEQMVVTDATGLYRVPQLPPGTYTLRLEKEGYRPFTRGRHRRSRRPHPPPQRRAAPGDRRPRRSSVVGAAAGHRRGLQHHRRQHRPRTSSGTSPSPPRPKGIGGRTAPSSRWPSSRPAPTPTPTACRINGTHLAGEPATSSTACR